MEADPRHVDLVLEQLGLDKGASVTTPLVKCKEEDMDNSTLPFDRKADWLSVHGQTRYAEDRPRTSERTEGASTTPLGPPQKGCKISPRYSKTGAADPVSGALHEHQWLV